MKLPPFVPYFFPSQNFISARRNVSSFSEVGFSLVQMIITISIVGILSAIAIPSISFGVNPLGDTSNRIKNQIKLARIKAMSTTTAYRFKPISDTQIEIQRHLQQSGSSFSTCNDAATETDGDGNPLWQRVQGYSNDEFIFEDGVKLTRVSVNGITMANPTNWQLCFNSRGLSNQSVELELTETSTGETMSLLVFMGGSIDISES